MAREVQRIIPGPACGGCNGIRALPDVIRCCSAGPWGWHAEQNGVDHAFHGQLVHHWEHGPQISQHRFTQRCGAAAEVDGQHAIWGEH